MRLCHNHPLPQHGFSLLEVLVAMLVLAIGATGLGLLILASVQGTVQAGERSQATLQASELAQLIHASPAVWGHLAHAGADVDAGAPDCTEPEPCPDSTWISGHLQRWQRDLQGSLAQAEGIVCRDSSPYDGSFTDLACDAKGPAVVKVVWQDAANRHQLTQQQRLVLPLPQP